MFCARCTMRTKSLPIRHYTTPHVVYIKDTLTQIKSHGFPLKKHLRPSKATPTTYLALSALSAPWRLLSTKSRRAEGAKCRLRNETHLTHPSHHPVQVETNPRYLPTFHQLPPNWPHSERRTDAFPELDAACISAVGAANRSLSLRQCDDCAGSFSV